MVIYNGDDADDADDDEDDNDSDDDYGGCAEKKFQTVITSYNLLLSSIFPPKLTSRYMEEQAKTLGHKRKLLKTFPLASPLFLFKLFQLLIKTHGLLQCLGYHFPKKMINHGQDATYWVYSCFFFLEE